MIDYDAELHLHNQQLRQAYEIGAADHVLDIGCGTGQTTREAARLASEGMAIGIDVDEAMIARARELAAAERISNILFEVGDAAYHRFQTGQFDVAISRFGTMFFTEPGTAFRNIARAIRPGGRLVMMVWQTHDRNAWAVAIDRALGNWASEPIGAIDSDPFSLGEPTAVRQLLAVAGFESVTLAEVDVPVYYGRDVDAALDFVSAFSNVDRALQRPNARSSLTARLRSTLTAHSSEQGVYLDSRAWIVTARRR